MLTADMGRTLEVRGQILRLLIVLVLLQMLHAHPRIKRDHGGEDDPQLQDVRKVLLELYRNLQTRKNAMSLESDNGNRDYTSVKTEVEKPEEEPEAEINYPPVSRVVKLPDESDEEDLANEKRDEDPDPNSSLSHLLLTEEVDINGQKSKPSGLHLELMNKEIGDNEDKHMTRTSISDTEIDETKISSQQRRGVAKRNFLKKNRLWPQGIVVYEISDCFTKDQIAIIQAAMKEMSDKTCLTFIKRADVNTTAVGHKSYLRIICGQGCWSYVGMVFDGAQDLSLGPGCVHNGVAIHEICHALNMEHEQSRNDRDKYLKMIFANIQQGKNNRNMAKSDTRDLFSFDYESILQYYLKAAAKIRNTYTMRFKDRELEFLADSATGLTFYDTKDINGAYKCTERCGTNLPTCQNGGFVYSKCTCFCPKGLTGSDCSGIETDSGCGGIIDASTGPKTISSPNYPSNYVTGVSCAWLIKCPPGSLVKLTIKELKLTYTKWNNRCKHWLEMRYNLIGQTGLKKCGDTSNEVYTSTWDDISHAVYLKFDSKAAGTASKGVQLIAECIPAGCASSPCIHGTCQEDAVSVYKCICEKNYVGTHCEKTSASASFSCSFEKAVGCVFVNTAIGDNFDWTRHKGSTGSSGTGPTAAHGGTYYMYAEVSFKKPGEKARFVSSEYLAAQDWCLTFWYHMYGSTMGKFWVYGEVDKKEIWSKSSDQGTDWHKVKITVPLSKQQKIVIETTVGRNYLGDVAIDDLTLKSGNCDAAGNPCNSSPCKNGGTCTNPGMKFSCACTSTWSGATCEAQFKPCDSSPCKNGGTCTNSGSIFSCACTSTWTGATCTTSAGKPCDSSPCKNGGTCTNSGSIFSCACTSTWTGATCTTSAVKPCDSSPCKNGGTCTISGSTFICACTSTWTGATCTTSAVKPCDSSPCKNGGTCTNSGSIFSCACTSTWTGTTCTTSTVKPCDSSPCKNGGTCTNSGSIFSCACTSTWTGTTCTTSAVKPCDSSPCKNGGTCTNSGSIFSCACTSTWTGTTCTTSAGQGVTETCDFELADNCFMENEYHVDDVDWVMAQTGGTKSSSTGPDGAKQGSTYAYLEASYPVTSYDAAVLMSTKVYPAGDYCLYFSYNMHGLLMGSLAALIEEETTGNTKEVFRKRGDQGLKWINRVVPLHESGRFKVGFKAVRGTGYSSDIALDDISFHSRVCGCDSSPCLNGGGCDAGGPDGYTCTCKTGFSGNRCEYVAASATLKCSFEPNTPCFLQQSEYDDFDWTRRTGPTPSSNTGPSGAVEGDWYVHIETSGLNLDGDTAIFSTSELIFEGSDRCLTFKYNMNGATIGKLEVYDVDMPLFSDFNSSGDVWMKASVDVRSSDLSEISIQATSGQGSYGDIAIDDVIFAPGPC